MTMNPGPVKRLALALVLFAGCGAPADRRVDVTLRGDGSEYLGDGVHVTLQGLEVSVNGVVQTQTHGGVISFWYLRDKPDEIHFLYHQE